MKFSEVCSKRIHRIVQGAFFFLMVLTGIRFTLHALWAMGLLDTFFSRPPAVEAFLPISAMLALKRFCLCGEWDPVHPAGLAVLFLALGLSLFLRKSFCGWLCPIGAASGFLFRLGRRLGLAAGLPRWAAWILAVPKYLLLAFFLRITLFTFDLDGLNGFLFSRYNMVADTKMLLFFAHPSGILAGVLLALLAGSVVIPSFWCRCLCPYGALLGLLSLCSPAAVRRREDGCTGCGACSRACPQGIRVRELVRVSTPECAGCLECAAACPHGCIAMHAAGRRFGPKAVAAAVAGATAAVCLAAMLSGHWKSCVTPEMERPLHQGIETLRHY